MTQNHYYFQNFFTMLMGALFFITGVAIHSHTTEKRFPALGFLRDQTPHMTLDRDGPFDQMPVLSAYHRTMPNST